jgi:murein L,D-transpeptidase YcbB/YkuD
MKIAVNLLLFAFTCIFVFSCKDQEEKPTEKDIVRNEELFPERLKKNLTELVEYASGHNGKINDTTSVERMSMIRDAYQKNNYTSIWSADGSWISIGDSLTTFIRNSKHEGLFPDDYHIRALNGIEHQLQTDTLARKDAALWSRADVLLTDAFIKLAAHLKRGRLPYDSTSRKDTLMNFDSIYVDALDKVVQTKSVENVLRSLEPQLPGYVELKRGIRQFVDSADFREFTYLPFPFKDSIEFFNLVKKRLYEGGILDSLPENMDSLTLRKAIGRYQASKKMKPNNRMTEATIYSLNDTDRDRFKRIALSLDKYRLMPDTMPSTYVWVNIPSYNLKVVEDDTLAMESKVIVGTVKTRTPALYSEISNFITYPQWTVPYSIIFKEMLPAIQKDVTYLEKQNLMVVDKNDSVLDPTTIDWKKLNKKRFPYLIKQREGDDNSLGVMKFNFRNKYAVYLHDTNARWMFEKSGRALSHGCVRVQDWRELAHFLVRNDTIKYNTDTLASWIVRQEKHVVSGFKKVPLFIRYFTCEGVDGKIRFYDDIYGEDKILTDKYFAKDIK